MSVPEPTTEAINRATGARREREPKPNRVAPRYVKFEVNRYRGISSTIAINVGRNSLIPIIGVNESGKTTILHAIFAFDYYNDKLNDARHLQDTENLYEIKPAQPFVTAEVELDCEEFREILKEHGCPGQKLRAIPSAGAMTCQITRDLRTRQYSLTAEGLPQGIDQHKVARSIIERLPFILFFDDFRDTFDERIPIVADEGGPGGWLAIIQQLFRKTDPELSIFDLASMEDRSRRTAIAKVQKVLNETLTQEWQNFRLDGEDRAALAIELRYTSGSEEGELGSIELGIVETDPHGNEHFFNIRDRSKGFFWFFNFVMKLEFNPKVISGSSNQTIYLLDEPGSYLHAFAQKKLCRKLLQLSENNKVVYCTHSHYLLQPEVIPLRYIRVAEKSPEGAVTLIPIHEHPASLNDRGSAFQPVLDALEVGAPPLDLSKDLIVITEGVIDGYALEIFRPHGRIGILPARGAHSVASHIPYLMAWGVNFVALWDNDDDGRVAADLARQEFGDELAQRRFRWLPLAGPRAKKRILQNLFDGRDLVQLRDELEMPENSSFDKVIASFYYSGERDRIANGLLGNTREEFGDLFKSLGV